MNDQLFHPPFEAKEFKHMTHKDAQLYFEWFTEQIDRRVEHLRAAYRDSGEGRQGADLDFSKTSLITLWRWYRDVDETHQISIALDIGVYFAECLRNAYHTLKWGYMCSPKRLGYVNKPIVCGFVSRVGLDPDGLLRDLAKEAQQDAREDLLLRAYEDWAERVSSAA